MVVNNQQMQMEEDRPINIGEMDFEFLTKGDPATDIQDAAGRMTENLTPEEQKEITGLVPYVERFFILSHKAETGEFPPEPEFAAEGGVSIGSTNPSLDTSLRVFKAGVSVQARIGESNSSYSTLGQNSLIRFQGRNTGNTSSVYGDVGLDVDNQLLIFNDPGTTGGSIGTNPMVLDASGNLGIGTTSPAAGSQLTLRSSASTGITLLSASNTGECFINFSDNDDANVGQIFYGHTDDKMVFRTNDSSRITKIRLWRKQS